MQNHYRLEVDVPSNVVELHSILLNIRNRHRASPDSTGGTLGEAHYGWRFDSATAMQAAAADVRRECKAHILRLVCLQVTAKPLTVAELQRLAKKEAP